MPWARHAMTKGHCLFQLESGGTVSPPAGLGQSSGDGAGGKALVGVQGAKPPEGPGVLQFYSNKNS